jgi:hypothetical protein
MSLINGIPENAGYGRHSPRPSRAAGDDQAPRQGGEGDKRQHAQQGSCGHRCSSVAGTANGSHGPRGKRRAGAAAPRPSYNAEKQGAAAASPASRLIARPGVTQEPMMGVKSVTKISRWSLPPDS